MKITRTINQTRRLIQKYKQPGKTIGLVPTMGALHAGHLSLINRARKETDVVVVSVFVNPTQFGPTEDYLRYPRPFNKDKQLCAQAGVDVMFVPAVDEMYPAAGKNGNITSVTVSGLSDNFCGKFRPGHFKGVATVVTKLFNITLPDRAYFGEKDYQQLTVIKKMVDDLNMPVTIVPCKTYREKTGLAMSSRNRYLQPAERSHAVKINASLKTAAWLIKQKVSQTSNLNTKPVVDCIMSTLKQIPNSKIEYVAVCNADNLDVLTGKQDIRKLKRIRILAALWIGKTRLIDNISIELGKKQ
jgi:pantoate--beta-alanine ligase